MSSFYTGFIFEMEEGEKLGGWQAGTASQQAANLAKPNLDFFVILLPVHFVAGSSVIILYICLIVYFHAYGFYLLLSHLVLDCYTRSNSLSGRKLQRHSAYPGLLLFQKSSPEVLLVLCNVSIYFKNIQVAETHR